LEVVVPLEPTVTDEVVVQPPVAVTVTEYWPGAKPEIDEVVSPLLHKYVNGDEPVAVTLALPSPEPEQDAGVEDVVASTEHALGIVRLQ
jgi:hypothetical protein